MEGGDDDAVVAWGRQHDGDVDWELDANQRERVRQSAEKTSRSEFGEDKIGLYRPRTLSPRLVPRTRTKDPLFPGHYLSPYLDLDSILATF